MRDRRGPIAFAMIVFLASTTFGCGKKVNYPIEYIPPAEFLLGAEDVLVVTVWRNQDLSREVVIRPDGMISMPLIGNVKAAGLATDTLAAQITERLKEFKADAAVTVEVKEVNSHYVFVLGEVVRPNKYQLKSPTTVLQAIAIAGGLTIYADRNEIQVLRFSENGQKGPHEVQIPVRYNDLISGDGDPGNFFLRSGDTIVVP